MLATFVREERLRDIEERRRVEKLIVLLWVNLLILSKPD
jgi:hypothetical protein